MLPGRLAPTGAAWLVAVSIGALGLAPGLPGPTGEAAAQDVATGVPRSEAARISITWEAAPIRDVLLAFAAFSGMSIVPGAEVSGVVTADINDQPWDVALRAILNAQGLLAVEDEYGIIRVQAMESAASREAIEPIVTRAYRISFVSAAEIEATLAPLLSPRGSISVSPSTNTVIVSDIPRVHRAIGGALRAP